MRTIQEERASQEVPLFVHPTWRDRFDWLVQGTTGRTPVDGDPFDLGFFGTEGGGRSIWDRWRTVARSVGIPRIVQGRQVHGATVRLHGAGPPGVLLVPDGDGHATADAGVLLTVTVADCVPIFLVEPRRRVVALLHAGWRGIASGILERGVETLRDRLGVGSGALHIHAGPSICGECYEVGPEVHRALDRPDPGGPAPVDLRGILARRAGALGIGEDRITRSAWCTLCGDGRFFSHRGGDRERQAAVVGIRSRGAAG